MFTPHHVSHVRCHVSSVRCQVSGVRFVLGLVGGGSVINRAYQVQFLEYLRGDMESLNPKFALYGSKDECTMAESIKKCKKKITKMYPVF